MTKKPYVIKLYRMSALENLSPLLLRVHNELNLILTFMFLIECESLCGSIKVFISLNKMFLFVSTDL